MYGGSWQTTRGEAAEMVLELKAEQGDLRRCFERLDRSYSPTRARSPDLDEEFDAEEKGLRRGELSFLFDREAGKEGSCPQTGGSESQSLVELLELEKLSIFESRDCQTKELGESCKYHFSRLPPKLTTNSHSRYHNI